MDNQNRDKANVCAFPCGGLLLLDAQGQILFCTKPVEKILNLPLDAILHRHILELLPNFDSDQDFCKYYGNHGKYQFDYQRIALVGTADDTAAVAQCVLFRESMCGCKSHQIMERCATADLQEIIEGSFDGLLVTDADGNVQMVNQAYIHNTGIPKEQLVGQNMQNLVNPVWMKQSVVFLVKEQKGPVSLQHETQNGKHIVVTGMPVFDQEGNIKRIIVNSRDISEIYALNQKLQEAKTMENYYVKNLQMYEKNQGIVGNLVVYSNKIQQIFNKAKKVSSFDTSILINGESGVGKEEVARYIHRQSQRSEKPFIAINCGAIPENLLESELFGYEGGTFTGALKGGKEGLFEVASGGTLMLDEIGEMPLALQVKLLRVLESHEIMRIGGSKAIPVDVRLISATNADLTEMICARTFREDLYYRLNVINISIPPLRERTEDIPPLSLKFIHLFNIQYGTSKHLSYPVMQELQRYDWPGNIRELKNVIENMCVLSDRDCLQVNDIPWYDTEQAEEDDAAALSTEEQQSLSLEDALARYEKKLLLTSKERCASTRQMAEELGVNQSTIVRKLKKYKISI